MAGFDFTRYNFDQLISEVQRVLADASSNPAVWKDAHHSSTAQVLIQLIAFLVDNLHYMLERRTQENFLPTAKLLTSVGALANLLNYKPRRVVSSSGLLEINLTTNVAATGSIFIPKYTEVEFGGEVFTTLYEGVILQNNNTTAISIAEGPVQTIEINTATGEITVNNTEKVVTYDVTNKFIVIDDYSNIENDSFYIRTINLSTDTIIDSFNDVAKPNPISGLPPVGAISFASGTDPVFDVRMSNDGLRVHFGDNTFGKSPTDTLRVQWIKSQGPSVTVSTTDRPAVDVRDTTFMTIYDCRVSLDATNLIQSRPVYDGMRILLNGLTGENNNVYIVSGTTGSWTLTEGTTAAEGDNIFVQFGTFERIRYEYVGAVWTIAATPINLFSFPAYATFDDDITPVPNTYNFLAHNITTIDGGLLAETIDSIKVHAPDFVKTGNRAVTKHDFGYWTKQSAVGGIVDATAYGEEEIGLDLTRINNVYVVYLQTDASALTNAEKLELKTFLDAYKTITTLVVIEQATNIPIKIDVNAKLNPNLVMAESQVIDLIEHALLDFFTISEGSLGASIYHSDVVQYVHNFTTIDQTGLSKHLVENVTVTMRALKTLTLSSDDNINDIIPIPVLKQPVVPEDYLVRGSLELIDSLGASVAAPGFQIITYSAAIVPTDPTGLTNSPIVFYDFDINVDGTGLQTISIAGDQLQTFAAMETAINTELQALLTPAGCRILGDKIVIWSNTTGLTSSIAISLDTLFSATTGFSSIETAVVGTASTIDTTFDTDTGYFGVGKVNYRTGVIEMIKDSTVFPDGTYHIKYAQDTRQNFVAGSTQVILYDKQVLGNNKLSNVTIL